MIFDLRCFGIIEFAALISVCGNFCNNTPPCIALDTIVRNSRVTSTARHLYTASRELRTKKLSSVCQGCHATLSMFLKDPVIYDIIKDVVSFSAMSRLHFFACFLYAFLNY